LRKMRDSKLECYITVSRRGLWGTNIPT
jgi:hypothetical protein